MIGGTEEKVDVAIGALRAHGHTVSPTLRNGSMWFEIDRKMLATWEEMTNRSDGVYSFTELVELYKQRRADENQIEE